MRDRQGMLPLHVALARVGGDDASVETVRCLVEQWPESVQVPATSSGLVPLLLAATSNAPLDVLCFLVRRSPEIFFRP